MTRLLIAAVSLLALPACETIPELRPVDPVGRILHYERSNQDGSEPEQVWVFRPTATRVEVYKMRERCTNAALVTAELDDHANATQLVGGRLTRAGTQEAFGWLTLADDDQGRHVDLRTVGPDGPIVETVPLEYPAAWRLYDFDFADWVANYDHEIVGAESFPIELVLAWPEPGPDGRILRRLGRADAHFVGYETHMGHAALRFDLSGEAFSGSEGGPLWIDAEDGTLLEVRTGLPNHPGYTDYRLRLIGEDRGEAVWRAVLADHWRGCPITES